MASHCTHGHRVPDAGRGSGSRYGRAHPQPDRRPDVVHGRFVEAPGGPIPETAPTYRIREETYRRVLGGALGDQLDYYSEILDRYRFPDPSYESDFEDYLVRKYADRMIKLLIANGPVEAALAGRLQARLPSQPPIVFVEHDARPVPKSTGHTYRWAMKESLDLALRVHPDTRHVFVVCAAHRDMGRRKVSLAGARAAARRGVHLLARRLAAGADPPAGGAAGALDCLSGLVQCRS